MANTERQRVLKILKDNGWELLRQKGGHCQFVHPQRKDKITVPFRVNKNIELCIKRQLREGKGR